MQDAPFSPDLPAQIAPIWGCVGGLFGLALLILSVVIYWRIFSKAGYSGALGLLMFIPIANLIALLILAFGTWPIEEELRRLRGGSYRE
ncbi:MAG: hypothetical protein ACOX9A_16260 [Anaerolineae bacterium]